VIVQTSAEDDEGQDDDVCIHGVSFSDECEDCELDDDEDDGDHGGEG
jgi:hypothetical protein